jgi:hypothetical protein
MTRALQRLKAFYERPVEGLEFSQVFAVYLLILTSVLLYVAALAAGVFAGLFNNIRWREWVGRDYALFALFLGLGLGELLLFFWGPSSPDYRSIFGGDFVTSMCVFVPFGQLLILVGLTIYLTMGASLRKKA